jgi:hypothetical protein
MQPDADGRRSRPPPRFRPTTPPRIAPPQEVESLQGLPPRGIAARCKFPVDGGGILPWCVEMAALLCADVLSC